MFTMQSWKNYLAKEVDPDKILAALKTPPADMAEGFDSDNPEILDAARACIADLLSAQAIERQFNAITAEELFGFKATLEKYLQDPLIKNSWRALLVTSDSKQKIQAAIQGSIDAVEKRIKEISGSASAAQANNAAASTRRTFTPGEIRVFILAVEQGNLNMVQGFISAGIDSDVDDPSREGVPILPILLAANKGHWDVVLKFLECEHLRISIGVLALAINQQREDVIQAFVAKTQAGKDNPTLPARARLFIWAIGEGDAPSIAQSLIERNIDNIPRNALTLAFNKKHFGIVCLLIDKGWTINFAEVDVSVIDIDVLRSAFTGKQWNLLRLFLGQELKIAPLTIMNDSIFTPAFADKQWDIVRQLLNQTWMNVNCIVNNGQTLLMLAVRYDAPIDIFNKILQGCNSDNLKGVTTGGNTVFSLAIINGQEEKLRLLLEYGRKVELRPFLERGAIDETALIKAIERNKLDVIALFLEETAEAKALIIWAAEQGYWNAVKILVPTMDVKNVDALFVLAIKMGHVEIVNRLFSEHNSVSLKGYTPFGWAAYNNKADIVQLILSDKPPEDVVAIVNAPDKLGRTPLLLAIQGDWYDMVSLLIGKGARVEPAYLSYCTLGPIRELLQQALESQKPITTATKTTASSFVRGARGLATDLSATREARNQPGSEGKEMSTLPSRSFN